MMGVPILWKSVEFCGCRLCASLLSWYTHTCFFMCLCVQAHRFMTLLINYTGLSVDARLFDMYSILLNLASPQTAARSTRPPSPSVLDHASKAFTLNVPHNYSLLKSHILCYLA